MSEHLEHPDISTETNASLNPYDTTSVLKKITRTDFTQMLRRAYVGEDWENGFQVETRYNDGSSKVEVFETRNEANAALMGQVRVAA